MRLSRIQTLKTVVHVKKQVPKFVSKVGKSVVPVTIYNIGIDHHDLSIQEISKNIIDTSAVEIISKGLKFTISHLL